MKHLYKQTLTLPTVLQSLGGDNLSQRDSAGLKDTNARDKKPRTERKQRPESDSRVMKAEDMERPGRRITKSKGKG